MDFEQRKSGLQVPKQKIFFKGIYDGVILRKGKVIDKFHEENLIVNQGLNQILSTFFNNGTQYATWYLGLFQGNYAPVSSDTAANWPTNATECSNYTLGSRPVWTPVAPASQSITNSASPASYTFNANVTIYGAALASSNVIGGTTGVLVSETAFQAPKPVETSDQLLLTWSFSGASS
jgi:hypothetical protein